MIVAHWTNARYWTYIRSGLRKLWSRYPNKHLCMKAARIARNEYVCAECRGVFGNKEVCVDHIDPCGSLNAFKDLEEFTRKLLCSLDNLQVMCSNCHYIKTMKERGLTDKDIQALPFKKMNAANQKKELIRIDISPASNAAGRIQQYRDTL